MRFADLIAMLPPDEAGDLIERAAIMQYEGNMTRRQAEAAALELHRRSA